VGGSYRVRIRRYGMVGGLRIFRSARQGFWPTNPNIVRAHSISMRHVNRPERCLRGGTAQPGMNIDLRTPSFWAVVGCAGTAEEVAAEAAANPIPGPVLDAAAASAIIFNPPSTPPTPPTPPVPPKAPLHLHPYPPRVP
jgi:hypothetical protein